MSWFYNGELVTGQDFFPPGTIGFVYLITNLKTGRKYIGKKLTLFKKTSVKTVTLKSGARKKKKVSTLVPSDWPTYWSSSVEVVEAVQNLGSEHFRRDILCFCSNRGSLGYYELKFQMDERVLENRDVWINGIVNARVHWSHIKPVL